MGHHRRPATRRAADEQTDINQQVWTSKVPPPRHIQAFILGCLANASCTCDLGNDDDLVRLREWTGFWKIWLDPWQASPGPRVQVAAVDKTSLPIRLKTRPKLEPAYLGAIGFDFLLYGN